MTETAVIDASFLLSFLFPDEDEPATDRIFTLYRRAEYGLISPGILPFEVINGLKSAVAQNRLKNDVAIQLMRDFLGLRISLYHTDFESTWQIANQCDLSIYDATYVELARITGYPLLTLDRRLRRVVDNRI